uniref:RNA helicase n=1 Tax=Oryza brachyantha TaxID=4533 RepID=J3LSQ6_ORYBR
MAGPSGGAEAHARWRKYDYGDNSDLVLGLGSRPRGGGGEPTGELETLRGRIDPGSFGDRAVQAKPPGGNSRRRKPRDSADIDDVRPADAKRRRRAAQREASVLSLTGDVVYKPRTKETRAAYEALLSVIQQRLGGQPLDVLASAADEVLAVLSNDKIKSRDKKEEIDKLLDPISNQMFHQLISIGKLITDFHDTAAAGDSAHPLDEDIGVSVDFEDNEDDEESDYDQVQDFDEDDYDDMSKLYSASAMQMDGELDDDDDKQNSNEGLTIDVHDIDAYWLQRKVSQTYTYIDSQRSRELAEQILSIISEGDDQDVESRLLMLLDCEKFDFIKLLLLNRLKIVWCTRLARAEDQEQREKIEEDMLSNPTLTPILEQLHATRVSAKDRLKNMERSFRDEAQRLTGNGNASSIDGPKDHQAVEWDMESEWLKGQRQLLDLESLSFHQGGLLMANEKCELPPGSFRTPHEGYEEVHVPAPKAKPYKAGEKIVKISDMPEWAQPAFAGMTQLNRVQSKVYDTALFKPNNILLCAPTGSGKTNVAVLTILQQIGLHMKDGEFDNTKYKIVYVAPMKALVAEVVGNLSTRLKEYNVTVRELSGDRNLTKQQIDETQIIVTTPEKWDIVTRKSGERIYTQTVKLLIIDEIHLLHDNRGPVLESIVSRTMRQIETTKEHVRLVGLSATLPNYEDVAVFLHVRSGGLFHFDNSYRPCPLAQQYIGITVRKPLQRFQLMNRICYEKVMAAAGKHQVIIFVHSRKETAKTARAIRDTAFANGTLTRFLKDESASQDILGVQADLVKSSDLKDLLPYGFGIHHAGLARADRELIEGLFANKHLQVLVSTATLAWGVNLPAHTVIIKGTQIYNPEKGAWTELSPLDVMQMLGRAGRPQYDTHGQGIILTGHSELKYYLSLMNQQLPIESQFISRLADQLNAEIVLGTIQNVQEACSWLGYTYLYIRMLRNPTLYGLPADVMETDKALYERRVDLVHSAANLLDRNDLIKYDRKTRYFQVTDLGRIASYYYVTHRTISTYNECLKPTIGHIELCQLLSLSEEFKYVSVRQDEKIELAKLINCVPIPVKDNLEEPSAKINVLLQVYISRLKLEGLSLSSDMVYIRQNAGRLARALFEIVLKRGWAQPAEKALNLCKMIDKQMWNIQIPLHQFPGIPKEILMNLEKKALSWERYYDLSSQEIGELIRYPKLGRQLHNCIHQLPKLTLSAHVQPITHTVLCFELTIIADFQWDDKVHGYVEPFWLIVEDNGGENILHHEYFMLKKQYVDEDHTLNFTVPICVPLPPQYFIRVVSDKWLGSETILPVSFKHLTLPEKYAPPTELLDLQPLPVTALRNARYESLYSTFKHFNPIQTQVFTALYNGDDSVLVAAPSGSGKTICAEFAILRNHQEASGESNMRVVYVAPIEAIAKQRYKDWESKFGELARVVELTGETEADLKLLDKGEIIISTTEKWDALSRRWKQRKQVQQVSLFIVDEVHLIGSKNGHILEIIISRMRRIANHIGSNIRVVALSASLANAKDLGEWIGTTSHSLFNFSPAVRPVPLEIHIQGCDVANFEARMQAMSKPTYTTITQHAKHGKPALVFVPTHKHARLTALDLCAYSSAERCGTPFLLGSEEEMDTFTSSVNDETLKCTLKCGVGYLHEGLSDLDQELVTQLFLGGRIQVCVTSSTMCWGRSLPSHLVVVMGTQYYDGRGKGNTDYPITDLLQMMGYANRPLEDNYGICVILCYAPRKEYYRKFLFEAFPVESNLHHFLHDHMNAEVVAGLIENKQDAVDYLTWTFMYRRLTKNPNYYNLQGVSQRHISENLSELAETMLNDLESTNCLAIEDNMYLKTLNLGLIASYYYVSYTTIERFSSMLTQKTKMKGLLEILASASEYAGFPSCYGEKESIEWLVSHQRFSIEKAQYDDPHVRANKLLECHFSRRTVEGGLAADQREILLTAPRLLRAMVDVVSSNGWLTTALDAMELSQMVIQGMWDRDSVLLQLPHFTKELVRRCQENEGKAIESIFDLAEMSMPEMQDLLQLPNSQLQDIIEFVKNFPNIDMAFEVHEADDIRAGDNVTVQVTLERERTNLQPGAGVGPVHAPRFPKPKAEGWWLVIGDSSTDQLLAIKRVALQKKRARVKLQFTAPAEAGRKDYRVYLMSDSYLGCDQEYELNIDVKDAGGN